MLIISQAFLNPPKPWLKSTFTHTRSGGGWKIGFITNHYMRSHIRGGGAEAEREQNPLRNKWVQHPIFRVRFETARPKPLTLALIGCGVEKGDFDIPALLRHRGYVYTYAERTRTDLPIFGNKDGLEREVSKRTRKIVCWTHLLRSEICPRSASAPRPRLCERM